MVQELGSTQIDIPKLVKQIYQPTLFAGKTVLVTGGSRGIGQAICLGFGALGAKIIVNYTAHSQAALQTLDAIKSFGGSAVCAQFDVSDFSGVQNSIKLLEKEHGPIETLINNAGISRDNLFVKFKEEDWDATLNTNLKGAFNCARAVAMGMMRQRAGKIINISSVVGILGAPGQCAYAASKAGLIGFTRALALEFANRNVQVNAIAPGYITTDMTDQLNADQIEKIKSKIPCGKVGSPIEIAKAAIFLASSAGDYMTGQVLSVDGGLT